MNLEFILEENYLAYFILSKNIADKLGFDYFITNKNVYMKNGYSIDSIKMIMNKDKWKDINKVNYSRK